jgi:mono/diheme cytochrome c family protein
LFPIKSRRTALSHAPCLKPPPPQIDIAMRPIAIRFVASTSSLLAVVLVAATPARAQSRGELLYATHCGACHTEKMHWRENKQVKDWPSLRRQVRQWQGAARLEWTDDDIEQVARYLNEAYYRLAAPQDGSLVGLGLGLGLQPTLR